MVLRLPTALLAVISTVIFSPAVHGADLESVLAGQVNVTTFRGLIKVSNLGLHFPLESSN
jgi:hypothetical protein